MAIHAKVISVPHDRYEWPDPSALNDRDESGSVVVLPISEKETQMGLMEWFKNMASGKPAAERDDSVAAGNPAAAQVSASGGLADNPEEGIIAGLDFKSAIDAHMKWKVRLEKCISDNNQEGLKVDVVSRDDQCPLGKWLHGPGGQRFGNLREFQEMKMEHARFHLCAGDVLACCLAGDKEGASEKLRSGDYTRTSERVKLHLARLYVQVSEKG